MSVPKNIKRSQKEKQCFPFVEIRQIIVIQIDVGRQRLATLSLVIGQALSGTGSLVSGNYDA